MIRVGLAGCGFIGWGHSWCLWALKETGLVKAAVTAAFDPDLERARGIASTHDAEVCEDLSSLLDRVDVVWVCTPTSTHLPIVQEASARDLAVFCEKPLAPTLAECEKIAADLRRVPHQVGLVMRHAPVFARISELLSSGIYGRVMTAILRDDQYFPIQGQYGSTWRADVELAGGGTLLEHSIHDIDLLLWLLGIPVAVAARTESFFGHPGIEDLATVTIEFEKGTSASLVSVWHQILSRASTRRLEVFCENAVLWTEDDYTGPIHLETTTGHEVIQCEPDEWVSRLPVPEQVHRLVGLYAVAAKHFLDSIADRRHQRSGFPTVEEAIAAHRVVDAAYRSARAGGMPMAIPRGRESHLLRGRDSNPQPSG